MDENCKRNLTKADIINTVQARVGLPKQVTSAVVDDLFEIIKDCLEQGESVKISGFGNFEVRRKKARQGRNPQSGEKMIIGERNVLVFKPSEVLRKAVRNAS